MPAALPYREAAAAAIVRRLAAGESLERICGKDGIPIRAVVMRWAKVTPHFARRLRVARQAYEARRLARRRPQAPTPELITEICARLEAGEALNDICRTLAHMPLDRVARRWLTGHAEFARRYRAALERKAAQRRYSPRRYSEAIAEEICRRLAGRESLYSICRDPRMPCYGTIKRWREGKPRFDRRFLEAKGLLAPLAPPRPGAYSAELFEAICERLGKGEALIAICAAPDMPTTATVFRWMRLAPGLARRYALAREEAQERRMDGFVRATRGNDPRSVREAWWKIALVVWRGKGRGRGAAWKYLR